MVKIEKIGFLRQDPGLSDLILAMGPNLSWKRAKRKCLGLQMLFGTTFL